MPDAKHLSVLASHVCILAAVEPPLNTIAMYTRQAYNPLVYTLGTSKPNTFRVAAI